MSVPRVTRLLGAGAMALGLALSACGGRDADQEELEVHTPQPVSEEQEGDLFEPAQYWALRQVFTTLVVLPVVGTTEMAAQSDNYYVLTMRRDGDTLVQDETYCWTSFEEVAGISTWLTDDFYAATGVSQRIAQLSEPVVGGRYLAPEVLTVYGADLADPARDSLPTDPDDRRVVDVEGDGNPGFTAVVDGWIGHAESYMVQRTVTTMSGQIIRDDRIEGTIDNTLEQIILDATKWWAGLDGFESVPSGKPEENFFILQAVDGPMSCDQLRDQADTLFK